MRGDPYRRADRLQRRHRRRAGGIGGRIASIGVPLLTAVILTPLVQRVFLSFLEGPEATWADGTDRVVIRLALVVVGWLSIDVYTGLVRGEQRPVLALLPVDPAPVVSVQLAHVARRRWWLLVGSAIVLSPIAIAGAPALWGAAVLVTAGAFALGLTASALVFSFAIQLAEDDRFAGLLDAIRGPNVRAQAAFIYAPGVVLIGVGGLMTLAAQGASAAAEGVFVGLGFVVLPFVLAGLALLPLPGLARRTWFAGTVVVGEIDARDAALADPEEALSVYLDWTVRWLPPAVGRYALNDLRHGWRTRRTLVSAAFLLGLVTLGTGWRGDPAAPYWVVAMAAPASFLVASIGLWLDRDEPEFLWRWLRSDPSRDLPRTLARLWVLVLWQLPIGLLGAVGVLVFAGIGPALAVIAGSVVVALVAAGLAVVAGRQRARAFLLYAPLAAVLAAAVSAAILEVA
ncbi:MAG: hypothetical protein AAF602_05765 [Myxococcota bacterium]